MPFLLTYIDFISTLKFFSMRNTDCSIEISGVPAVCKLVTNLGIKLETVPDNLAPRAFFLSCPALKIRKGPGNEVGRKIGKKY